MALAVTDSNTSALISGLTEAVDEKRLGFPRAVADDLMALVRREPPAHPIWAWAKGLTTKLDPYVGNVGQRHPLMGHIVELGFEHGLENLVDNKEGCLVDVGCLCLDLCEAGRDFILVTEDLGEHPLRPTMGQLAKHCGWPVVGAVGALDHLDLGHLTFL